MELPGHHYAFTGNSFASIQNIGFLRMTDSTGNLLWSKNFSFNNGEDLRTEDLLLLPNHDLISGGGGIETPIFMSKFDSVDNLLWIRKYGSGFANSVAHAAAIYDEQHMACAGHGSDWNKFNRAGSME